jgi:small subunit ribosomal protein S9
MKETLAVGRRKTAVASIRMRKGKGLIEVNGKKITEYFPLQLQQKVVLSPLEKLELQDKYDVLITLKGGGLEAQAEAARLGISRAIVKENEDQKHALKDWGYLTRDPRKRERKKYGLAGARKRYQYSKR